MSFFTWGVDFVVYTGKNIPEYHSFTHTHPYTKHGNFYKTVFLFLISSCLGMYGDQIWRWKYFFHWLQHLEENYKWTVLLLRCLRPQPSLKILGRQISQIGPYFVKAGKGISPWKDITFNLQTVEFMEAYTLAIFLQHTFELNLTRSELECIKRTKSFWM